MILKMYWKVDLLNTLYVYLQNGGNLEQTADQLALSVSGLRYRMSKVDSLLGATAQHRRKYSIVSRHPVIEINRQDSELI